MVEAGRGGRPQQLAAYHPGLGACESRGRGLARGTHGTGGDVASGQLRTELPPAPLRRSQTCVPPSMGGWGKRPCCGPPVPHSTRGQHRCHRPMPLPAKPPGAARLVCSRRAALGCHPTTLGEVVPRRGGRGVARPCRHGLQRAADARLSAVQWERLLLAPLPPPPPPPPLLPPLPAVVVLAAAAPNAPQLLGTALHTSARCITSWAYCGRGTPPPSTVPWARAHALHALAQHVASACTLALQHASTLQMHPTSQMHSTAMWNHANALQQRVAGVGALEVKG